ncbi:fatty acid synthase-like [Cydia splendana]|uniref:fatty acid synthase-like n=1 Tax=Cydia splendana TaxID=1100963 RepID=UPI00300C8121
MVPSPQERKPETAVGTMDKDRVVISGISGLYPQSHHIKDLADILYKKDNPVTAGEPRWKFDHPEVPPFVGTVPKIDRFDAQFFKVHYRLSTSTDPMARKILEQAYQAIYDSGVSPEHLSGKKIGVFIGSCFSETEKACFYVASSRTGFGIAGCNKSMFANRVSYWLNAKGPSQSIDAGCCSSTVALEQAYLAMTRGDCEAAIVGGSNLCLHPQSSMHYGRIISLCKDGKTKSYDQNADGCARSEAINVLFLQKAKDALRIYADVVHVKNKFLEMVETDTGPKYGFYRNPVSMSGFLKEFYEEAKILPNEVEYIEGFGSGDTEADKVELEAFDKVFCGNRSEPLLVGSVMSNLGYCEAASGITAITKVLLGYHTGEIAGNLHCTTPRNDVEAIQKGRMRILTDHQHFKRTYVGVNGMSVTGINSHVLLHGHFKQKDPTRYQCSFPRLVTISARQDVAVRSIIDDLKSRPIDPEELALLHNIHSSRISGHVGRGFVILGTDKDMKTMSLCEKASYCDASDRPLWFVYSGMGSQWTGMGKALMRIPIFSDAIERCRKVLEPKGVDIVHIITSPDKSIYDNILNSFVGIAAIQIGLTDILHELGLVPDKIIGHSVGELGCAYADGCLTAEEMILSAYSRGLVSVQTPFIRGSMAAVGIGFEKVSKMCPPEIEVACHNGPDSCTISGPSVAMTEFVAQLTAKGIFAKEVPCSNIAYHSRYIAEAGPALRKYLTEVISTPKLRSPRWVSTSVPQERWNEEAAKYSSAEYHTNNLLNPVLFEETSRLIPQNAVLVEVAPHGLLQAILKRSLPSSCVNVALTRRGHADNAQVLLEAIGQLYMEGYYPNIRVLYPKIDFPVSTGTPHLSHLVEWAHNETWFLPLYVSASRKEAAACKFVISLHDRENNYLQGHVIQGKTVYPFAGALVAVWDTMAMSLGVARKQLSVQFRDVHLFAQPLMHDSRQLRLSVTLNWGTGLFEVTDDCSKVATGYVNRVSSNVSRGFNHDEKTKEVLELTTDDVYNILFERHYRYAGEFQSISSANSTFTEGYLLWEGNWVTLIDGMLQLNVLRQPHEGISQPAYIRKISIDIKRHLNQKNIQINDLNVMKTNICAVQDSTSCEGILLEGIRFREIMPADENKLALKALNFVPRFQSVRDLKWGGEYYESLQQKVSSNCGISLNSAKIGDLESLRWIETSGCKGSGVPVKVHFAGLNINDAKRAYGEIPFEVNNTSESYYGMDFSGTTETGERVIGVIRGGAVSDRVLAHPELMWPVPDHWSLEDAATVPLSYAHAFYCLFIKSELQQGSSIVVHGGAGGLGQAIISIALHMKCEVFVAVSDIKKKQYLQKLYPQLKEDHIGCSRDKNFSDLVLSHTNGRGCNVVITCGQGEIKTAFLKCCAPSGYTLDTSPLKSQENYMFGMSYMVGARSYISIDFASIFESPNKDEWKKLQDMVAMGIKDGYVRPLPRVSFMPEEATRAFRLLAASRHRGRILLRLQPALPQPECPRLVCTPDHSQMLISDEEGPAIRLGARLIKRGARTLHLHLPTHLSSHLLKTWENLGVKIQISTEELTNSKDISNLLSESWRMGPVEGIFVLITKTLNKQKQKMYETLVDNLDLAARKTCPTMKYFAVVGINNFVGQRVCLSRASQRLPAMMLNIPQELTDARQITNAVERGLCSQQSAIFAHTQVTASKTLLHQIAAISGIPISIDTFGGDGSVATLQDLGISSEKTRAVSIFLRDTYNVCIDDDKIPFMTVEKLRDIEEMSKECEYPPKQGLDALFTYVDPDELLATVEMMAPPTHSHSSQLRDDELDNQATMPFLCVIPGLEGHHHRYRLMCERLKLQAFVLQPGLDRPGESNEELTARYVKIMLKKMNKHKRFYLLGYEMGVLTALEMAAILEDQGMTGTVFCLGGGPEDFLTALEEQINTACAGEDSEQVLQDTVARHMCALMGSASTQLATALRNASTWREKVDVSVSVLRGRVTYSAQYARALIEAAYARVTQARNARARIQATPRALQSRVVLLRSPTAVSASPHPLQRYTRLPLAIHDLRAPLAHATDDLRVAAIVNQYLDDEVLQEFENKNICETYLLNADVFMTV